jgi:hypothetical protein
MRPAALVVVLAVAVLAGCGARSNTPFTAQGTIGCLKKEGFTQVSSRPAKVGFIAGFAANGGLVGAPPSGNKVTIAFGKDETEVESTKKAFKLAAPPDLRPHMSDVTRSSRNAVIVWTTSPSSEDERVVEGCLAP